MFPHTLISGTGEVLHQLPAPWGLPLLAGPRGRDLSVSGAFPIISYNQGRENLFAFCKKLLVIWRSKKACLAAGRRRWALLLRAPRRASGSVSTVRFRPRAASRAMSAAKTSQPRTPPAVAVENVSTTSGAYGGSPLFFSNTAET